MDGISRSRGWDKEIPHGVLPMEQLVLSDKWARNCVSYRVHTAIQVKITYCHRTSIVCAGAILNESSVFEKCSLS